MTDTTELTATPEPAKRRGLTAMRLAELQDVAAGLGIPGVQKMRKGDLITAIRERQGGAATTRSRSTDTAPASAPAAMQQDAVGAQQQDAAGSAERPARRSRRATTGVTTPDASEAPLVVQSPAAETSERPQQDRRDQDGRTDDRRADRDHGDRVPPAQHDRKVLQPRRDPA